jgi:6-phosphogluconate dehydrogenase
MENQAKGSNVIGAHSVAELCENLKTPRRIILLVKAGDAVDAFIQQLEPHLEKGDIIIDGGNSHFPDTNRRCKELEAKGLLFVGSGVSGGEEGARYGPSLSSSLSLACFTNFQHCICQNPKLSWFELVFCFCSAWWLRGCLASHQGNLSKSRGAIGR